MTRIGRVNLRQLFKVRVINIIMKKILIIFLFCSLPLAANDFDFQQVKNLTEILS